MDVPLPLIAAIMVRSLSQVVPPHAIATRSNFLRFGKRSMEAAAPISEDGDDGDVSEAFEGPVRRDYREFVR